MSPLDILKDILVIAQAIQDQVDTAKNNKAKLKTLAHTMQLVIASLQGLNALPNTKQFIQTFTEFQTHLRGTKTLIVEMAKKGKLERYFYAQTNEGLIDGAKQRIVEFIPLLNLGLNAQLLIDHDRDRHDNAADRQAFVAQKEEALRKTQAAAHIDQHERDAIILKQLDHQQADLLLGVESQPIQSSFGRKSVITIFT